MTLSKNEIHRYSRQIQNEFIGQAGQEKIKQASVLIIGLGGLGSPLSLYLAAAGVGRIGLIDFDLVDTSNLQRQILYGTSDAGKSKAEVAGIRLKDLNPEIQIDIYNERLTIQNALHLFAKYDIIADGADNFSTRYLVNDACFFSKRTLVSASVFSFEGQLAKFHHNGGACYRCLYPEPPPPGLVPSCSEAGVLGVLPGVMGSLQATEVLKVILNLGQDTENEILHYNAIDQAFNKFNLKKDPTCPLCSDHPKIKSLNEIHFTCEVNPSRLTPVITAMELNNLLSTRAYQILDVREKFEVEICALPYTHHIPLSELENRIGSLSQETPVIVYCKSGSRSETACRLLLTKGFNCKNLQGGILEWIQHVDPSLKAY